MPLAALTRAPLEEILTHAQITRHAAGEMVCSGDEFSEWSFMVLSGSCEEYRVPASGEKSVLRAFRAGAPFGGGTIPNSEEGAIIVAAREDAVVLRIRSEDLNQVGFETNRTQEHPSPLVNVNETRASVVLPPAKGKVTTLLALSPTFPAPWLAERIAQSLHAETDESVAVVHLIPATTKGVEGRDAVELDLERQTKLPQVLPRTELGFCRVHVRVAAATNAGDAMNGLLEAMIRRFDHVLIETRVERIVSPVQFRCLARSESAYPMVEASEAGVHAIDLLLLDLRPKLNSHIPVRIKPVLCLAEDGMPEEFDEQIEQSGIPIHLYLRECPTRMSAAGTDAGGLGKKNFIADVRRLARDVGDRLVGLALSSGGAKGYAHIGVIQVLEEHGVEVDVVAGSSMGSYVGALWTYGWDGSAMAKLAWDMEGRWAVWSLLDPVFPPRQGFLRGFALKHRLMRSIGAARFANLTRPLRVVAARLNTQEREVFSSGVVANAVHASMAVPGICVPVTLGGETYVDGGIVDPLPVDVLSEMGIRRIIAVNTVPTPERIRYWLQKARSECAQIPAERRRKLWRKVLPLDKHLNYLAPGNILEILVRSIHGAQTRVAEAACRHANLVLRPEFCDDHWLDIRNPRKYIAAGREIALRHLPEIKSLARQKGEVHEQESATESLVATA